MLDFGSRGLGLTPDKVNVFCFWAKHFILTASALLHTGVEMSTEKIPGKPDKLVGGEGGASC